MLIFPSSHDQLEDRLRVALNYACAIFGVVLDALVRNKGSEAKSALGWGIEDHAKGRIEVYNHELDNSRLRSTSFANRDSEFDGTSGRHQVRCESFQLNVGRSKVGFCLAHRLKAVIKKDIATCSYISTSTRRTSISKEITKMTRCCSWANRSMTNSSGEKATSFLLLKEWELFNMALAKLLI